MKNRSTTDNLRNLLTIVDFCNTNNLDSILISVDFNSPFDSCSWCAIKEILIAYNYPPKFVDMVMVCYMDIKTTVMNNNKWSEWIFPKSGVRQGCPLSGIIFNHLISILELKIKQNGQIEGITIPGCETKLLDLFADDLWNCIRYDKDSFDELMFEYSEFEAFAGLAINYDKTEIMRMGSIRNTNARFYSQLPLHWSDGPIKVLGLMIYNSWQNTSENAYQSIFGKIENTLNSWKWRSLTPIGKIQIVNSITNAYFVYKLQVLPSPTEKQIMNYKKMVVNFIWDGKKSKIAYNRLIASNINGGLQLKP